MMNYCCSFHPLCLCCQEEAMDIELQKERQPIELRIKVQQSLTSRRNNYREKKKVKMVNEKKECNQIR